MSQGRTSVIRALGAVCMILTVPAVDAQTIDAAKQKTAPVKENPPKSICRPPQNITANEALVKGGYVAADGKVHFTFGIEPDADSRQEQAFREAVSQWNKLSDVSWMVLEPGAPGGSIDIRFGAGSIDLDENGKAIFYCGKHDPNDSSVRYHPSNMEFAKKRPGLAVKIYLHEIGHVLGLNHFANGTLMDPAVSKPSDDCEEGARKTKPILPSDAQQALRCALAIHYWHRPPP